MITKIVTIKDLGVFKDFKWNIDSKLQEFKEKNIIYGWNYSGKTTLSRIFTSLRDKSIHPDYPNASFLIKTESGSEFGSENIENNTFKIIVFNREYIESKITWGSKSKFGEPIAFDVGENVEIRNEIDKLQEKINRANDKKTTHQPHIDLFNEFEKFRFTNVSKTIRLIISNNTIPFDKGHFKSFLETITKDTLNDLIINDKNKVEELKKISNSSNEFSSKNKINFTSNYDNFKTTVKTILNESPPKDVVIDILEKNKNLYDWTKQGLDFEENKEICSFCGNPVTQERITELNNYFSNKSKSLRDRISVLRDEINKEIKTVQDLEIPKSKNDFTEKVRDKIELKINAFKGVKSNYIIALKKLLNELDRKEDGNIFNTISLKDISYNSNEFSNWITETNKSIKEHNELISNFEEQRDKARKKLTEHLIAEFLINEDYFLKNEKAKKAKSYIVLYDKYIAKTQRILLEKQDSLKTITKGKNELNKFIQKFLNRSDIEIIVTEEDKFLLLRKGKPAKNLSEGEKTAIAFSYFLVEFESLGVDEMQQTIVFIDDPISSLDTNHIAQVYSLINSYFFRKGISVETPDKIINCFKQLFISTHNFEFFSFLKDSSHLKKKKKDIPNCGFYLIQQIDTENSTLKGLPKALKKYKSEYIYLFSLIYDYYNAIIDGNDTFDILIPNALRRFLEIYTLMKIPNEPDSVENRISQLVDDVNQFKLLNHFSHFTTFEKATRFDELMMVLPDATKELIKLLELDTKHFESLKKSILV